MLQNSNYGKDVKQMFSELDEKIWSLHEKEVLPSTEEGFDVFKLKSNAKRSSIAFNTCVPVRRGLVTLVFGPNGSGKTNFLQSFLNDLYKPGRKIALGTRSIANWMPFVDEVYGGQSHRIDCVDFEKKFIAEVDKIVDEINSANGKNFLIVIDSVTDIVEHVAVMLETKSLPSSAGGFKPDTLRLIRSICSLAGFYANGNCVTIIGTLVKNERNHRQAILCQNMIGFCSAYITLCRPNSNFEQVGELSVDYLHGDYGLYGCTENIYKARQLYGKIKQLRRSNDYLNTLVNKTNTFIVK